jgi:hypothetical protein
VTLLAAGMLMTQQWVGLVAVAAVACGGQRERLGASHMACSMSACRVVNKVNFVRVSTLCGSPTVVYKHVHAHWRQCM